MPSNYTDPRNIGHPTNNVTISSNIESPLVANKLKIMSLNIFSLMPHIDELRIMTSNEEPHIIEIKVGNYKPFIVTSLYRPPDKPVSHFDEIEALVSTIYNKNLEFIIIRDTNCNFMDKTDNDTKHSLKFMTSYNLQQLIKDYIRVIGTTKTCIDHILTNKLDTVLQSGVLPCGISDHDIVFIVHPDP